MHRQNRPRRVNQGTAPTLLLLWVLVVLAMGLLLPQLFRRGGEAPVAAEAHRAAIDEIEAMLDGEGALERYEVEALVACLVRLAQAIRAEGDDRARGDASDALFVLAEQIDLQPHLTRPEARARWRRARDAIF